MSRRKLHWRDSLSNRTVCRGGAECRCGANNHHSHEVIEKTITADMLPRRLPNQAKDKDGHICTQPIRKDNITRLQRQFGLM
jgi:hypothetical protein